MKLETIQISIAAQYENYMFLESILLVVYKLYNCDPLRLGELVASVFFTIEKSCKTG